MLEEQTGKLFNPKLNQGQLLNNEDLCNKFGCSPQGGMRRSHKTVSLVIVSDHIKSVYEDEWKGDVARMVMYVNLSYGDDFDEVGSLELFLKWNREDPVSAFELQRNNVIESVQGNRNPFIDNPYLATLLWGGEAAENTWD